MVIAHLILTVLVLAISHLSPGFDWNHMVKHHMLRKQTVINDMSVQNHEELTQRILQKKMMRKKI
jgi:hypothetical protein